MKDRQRKKESERRAIAQLESLRHERKIRKMKQRTQHNSPAHITVTPQSISPSTRQKTSRASKQIHTILPVTPTGVKATSIVKSVLRKNTKIRRNFDAEGLFFFYQDSQEELQIGKAILGDINEDIKVQKNKRSNAARVHMHIIIWVVYQHLLLETISDQKERQRQQPRLYMD